MYLVAIAWVYVVGMMAVAEATSSTGTVLGALVTLLFYGVLPLGIVLYLMGSPARRRARRRAEQADVPASGASVEAEGGGLPARDAVAPKREEP